jgi:acyl-homoserine lactone acylase PvdQ
VTGSYFHLRIGDGLNTLLFGFSIGLPSLATSKSFSITPKPFCPNDPLLQTIIPQEREERTTNNKENWVNGQIIF